MADLGNMVNMLVAARKITGYLRFPNFDTDLFSVFILEELTRTVYVLENTSIAEHHVKAESTEKD